MTEEARLVASGDKAMPNLAQLVSNLEQGLTDHDARVRAEEMARVRNQKGLIARLLPASQAEKAMEAAAATEIARVGEHNVALVNLHAAAQQALTKQGADALLQTHGVHCVTEVTSYAISRLERLNADLAGLKDRFGDRMLAEGAKMSKYESVPALHEAMLKAFHGELSAYFATVEELRSQFQDALKARVGKVGGSLA